MAKAAKEHGPHIAAQRDFETTGEWIYRSAVERGLIIGRYLGYRAGYKDGHRDGYRIRADLEDQAYVNNQRRRNIRHIEILRSARDKLLSATTDIDRVAALMAWAETIGKVYRSQPKSQHAALNDLKTAAASIGVDLQLHQETIAASLHAGMQQEE